MPSLAQINFLKVGCRTINGSLYLKSHSTISCNVTVTHEENAVGFVETVNTKGKPNLTLT